MKKKTNKETISSWMWFPSGPVCDFPLYLNTSAGLLWYLSTEPRLSTCSVAAVSFSHLLHFSLFIGTMTDIPSRAWPVKRIYRIWQHLRILAKVREARCHELKSHIVSDCTLSKASVCKLELHNGVTWQCRPHSSQTPVHTSIILLRSFYLDRLPVWTNWFRAERWVIKPPRGQTRTQILVFTHQRCFLLQKQSWHWVHASPRVD